jgi:hypothetical protein
MHVLLLTFSLIFLAFFQTEAQSIKTYYVVNSGEIPVQVIPQADQARYPEFRDGLIYYINGKTEARKLNYSVLYGEMNYLGPEGDTLALGNEQLVKKILIGEDEFYSLHGQGYAEVLSSTTPVQIARKETLKIILGSLPRRGYSHNNVYMGDAPTLWQIYNQQTIGLMKLVKEVSYLFIDQNQRFYPAKKAVLLKLFPGQKRGIDRFARINNIDFKQAEDLQKIVEFAAQQQKRAFSQ